MRVLRCAPCHRSPYIRPKRATERWTCPGFGHAPRRRIRRAAVEGVGDAGKGAVPPSGGFAGGKKGLCRGNGGSPERKSRFPAARRVFHAGEGAFPREAGFSGPAKASSGGKGCLPRRKSGQTSGRGTFCRGKVDFPPSAEVSAAVGAEPGRLGWLLAAADVGSAEGWSSRFPAADWARSRRNKIGVWMFPLGRLTERL